MSDQDELRWANSAFRAPRKAHPDRSEVEELKSCLEKIRDTPLQAGIEIPFSQFPKRFRVARSGRFVLVYEQKYILCCFADSAR